MNQKKNKLFIFPGQFHPHIGGLESHVDLFSKYLSRDKEYELSIIAPQYANAPLEEYIHEGKVRVLRYPAFMAIANFPVPKFWTAAFWTLFLNLYKEKPQFVMTRTFFFVNSTFGLFYAKVRFKPITLIHVEHAASLPHLHGFFKNLVLMFYVHTFGRLTLLLSNRIVCVSEGVQNFLEEYFDENPKELEVIRRGFELEALEGIKEDEELKKKAKEKTLLFFAGRLTEGKGVQDLIIALKSLNDDSLHLFIAGDGGYKKDLEKLVKVYNLKKQVTFLGTISHKRVLSCLKTANIFINPSYSEGLPTVVLDALFSETKTIATDVGGTKEILEEYWNSENYKLISSHSPSEIQEAIEELLKIKKKTDKTIQKFLEKRFNWENHVKAYKKLLESTMTTKKRQSKS